MKLHFNEGRACDAVIRRLERRDGGLRGDLRRPDLEPESEHRIELAFHINDRLYALEHTVIEPFEGRIDLDSAAPRCVQPLVERVEPLLPQTEDFELLLPYNAFDGLKGRKREGVVRALGDWTVKTAPTLEIGPIHRRLPQADSNVPGVPFPVQLHRSESIGPAGRRLLLRFTVPDVEDRRLKRIERALTAKCPKLAGWKATHGARTVLVLEHNDLDLTNVHFVTAALLKAEKNIAAAPDEVYLVMTALDTWFVWQLRVDGRTYFDLTDPEERCYEVSSTELVNLTDQIAARVTSGS